MAVDRKRRWWALVLFGFVLRRAWAAWQLGRGAPIWRQTVRLVAGGHRLCRARGDGAYRLVYHVPQFTGVGGVLVARLRNDTDDAARARFANQLARTFNGERLADRLNLSTPTHRRMAPGAPTDRRAHRTRRRHWWRCCRYA